MREELENGRGHCDTARGRHEGRESENPRIRENDKRTTMPEDDNARRTTMPEDDNVEGRESERTRREENVGGQECKRMTRRCTGVSKMAMSQ